MFVSGLLQTGYVKRSIALRVHGGIMTSRRCIRLKRDTHALFYSSDIGGKESDMSSISNVTNSALQAFSTAQQITAHNVANLNTDNFKASRTTFQENGTSGVTASASSTKDTVDISREVTNLISNTQGYKANIKVFKAADEMTKELLNIKA